MTNGRAGYPLITPVIPSHGRAAGAAGDAHGQGQGGAHGQGQGGAHGQGQGGDTGGRPCMEEWATDGRMIDP